MPDDPSRTFALAPDEGFLRYSQLPQHERVASSFVRLAQETKAFEVVGPLSPAPPAVEVCGTHDGYSRAVGEAEFVIERPRVDGETAGLRVLVASHEAGMLFLEAA